MCRGGRMFGPTKIWRRWHKKISVNQRRFAVTSALAATAVPALVMARGHKVDSVLEFPLVLSDSLNTVSRTKDAKKILERIGAYQDVDKVDSSKKVRGGAGKQRNRRYIQRKGPLIVYDAAEGLEKAFRNLSGVDLTLVDNLSLLDLAPGSHLGRFCIWTKGAFEKLDSLFGTYDESAKLKDGFNLPRSIMANADLSRIINSDEIQSVLRPISKDISIIPMKRNPLKYAEVKTTLNPNNLKVKKEIDSSSKDKLVKAKLIVTKKRSKEFAGRRKTFYEAAVKEGEVKF